MARSRPSPPSPPASPAATLDRELHQICGCTGSGKTSLAVCLLGALGPRRGFILDPFGDDPRSLSAQLGAQVFRSPRDLEKHVHELAASRAESWWVSFVPPYGREVVAAAWLGSLAKWAGQRWSSGGVWLVLEEAAAAARFGVCPPVLIELAQRGRHYGVSLLAISQRPSSIHPDLRAELSAGTSWVLRLTDWQDKRYLAQRRGPAFAERVSRLAPLVALQVEPSNDAEIAWRIGFAAGQPYAERLSP